MPALNPSSHWNLMSFQLLTPTLARRVLYIDFQDQAWTLATSENALQMESFARSNKDLFCHDLDWTSLENDLDGIQQHLDTHPVTIAILPGVLEKNKLQTFLGFMWPHLRSHDIVLIAGRSQGFFKKIDLKEIKVAFSKLRGFLFFSNKQCRTQLFICYARCPGSAIHLVSSRYKSQHRFIARMSQTMALYSRTLHKVAARLWLLPLIERDHILYVEKC